MYRLYKNESVLNSITESKDPKITFPRQQITVGGKSFVKLTKKRTTKDMKIAISYNLLYEQLYFTKESDTITQIHLYA